MPIASDSPFRDPPSDLSRSQLLVLDGIRYSAEMADLAYERLWNFVQSIELDQLQVDSPAIALALIDAWAIIDAVHRFHDLANHLRGLRRGTWFNLLSRRLKDALDVRNCIQHQIGEIGSLAASGGQIWGQLSWNQVRGGKATGLWGYMWPGSICDGETVLFIGPTKVRPEPPIGRVRLRAFNRDIYLGACVAAVAEATRAIEEALRSNAVRPVPPPAARVGVDHVGEGYIEVAVVGNRRKPDGLK